MAKPKQLGEKLRGVRAALDELAFAAADRFRDLEELGSAIAQLAKEEVTAQQLGKIAAYLAQDGASEIEFKIAEIAERIDTAIKDAEGQ